MRLALGHTIRLFVMKSRSRPPATSVHLPGTFRAFRDRNYRLLWPANVLAYSSRWMQMTLLGWLVLELTDSELRVALVGVFAMAPMLLLGLVGGVLADVVDRRRMLMGVHAMTFAAALVMAVLLWTGSERFWHAYAVILVAGIGWSFDMPARRSLFHDLFGRSGVTNAVALDSMGQSVSMMAGPALGGGLIAVLGVKGGYLAVTAFLMTSLVLVYRLKLTSPRSRRVRAEGAAPSLADGIRYVLGNEVLRATVLVTLAMNVLMFPYVNLIPVIARDVLHVGPGLMGLLQSAAGLGAAVGAISIASWVALRYHGRVYLGGAWMACLALLLFSFSEWYAVSFPLLLLVGLGTSGFSDDAEHDRDAHRGPGHARQGAGSHNDRHRHGPGGSVHSGIVGRADRRSIRHRGERHPGSRTVGPDRVDVPWPAQALPGEKIARATSAISSTGRSPSGNGRCS